MKTKTYTLISFLLLIPPVIICSLLGLLYLNLPEGMAGIPHFVGALILLGLFYMLVPAASIGGIVTSILAIKNKQGIYIPIILCLIHLVFIILAYFIQSKLDFF